MEAGSTQPWTSFATDDLVSGRYRIKRIIGRGGMGEVYEVRDELLHDDVALKTLRADLWDSDIYLRRFQKEIQLARKVTNPHVCRVFEVGVHEFSQSRHRPIYFFTMELLRGETLSARIKRTGRLLREEAFAIAVQMAEGLEAAHQAGIVHRDFKSGNVMLVPGPEGERAVVTDFGLAGLDPASLDPEETRSMMDSSYPEGTVAFMSPEQLTGKSITPRSDIYSFGIVLFQMATGKLPFDSRHAINSAVQRVTSENIRARALTPDIDPHWEKAIERCLQTDPARRFGSAAQLTEWFRESGGTGLYWTRRRYAAAVGSTALVLGAGGVLWLRSHRPYQPQARAREQYAKGEAALRSMTYEAARRLLEQATGADPRFALAHASLSRAYDELDYSDRAKDAMLRALTTAQEYRPPPEDEGRLRALQLLEEEDYARAVPLFRQMEEEARGQDRPAAALESGWLAEKMDETSLAASAYEHALQLDPNYAAARLRLGYLLGRRGRGEDLAAALNAFAEAERLYRASNDYEGITESMLQRAQLLNRRSRAGEAMPIIEQALSMARTVGNHYQEIRLPQLKGVAVRNLDDAGKAAELAQQSIDAASSQRMDNLATIGMLDLGNAHLVAGDLKTAEATFHRALDFARRDKVRRSEARALISLGSACAQSHRPVEASEFINEALPFYTRAEYRRELTQGRLLLGSVLEQLGSYDEGAKAVRDALPDVDQIQDSQLKAQALVRLGDNLKGSGDWPGALDQYHGAELLSTAAVRRGFAIASEAALCWRLGRREDGERFFSEARQAAAASHDVELEALLATERAAWSYADGKLEKGLEEARRGLAAAGHEEHRDAGLSLIEAASLIRTNRVRDGSQIAERTIAMLDRFQLRGDAAAGRLLVAEALVLAQEPAQGSKLASEALRFYEPRRIWESVWRCYGVAAAGKDSAEISAQRAKARAGFDQLKRSWPAASIEAYQRRGEIRRLLQAAGVS